MTGEYYLVVKSFRVGGTTRAAGTTIVLTPEAASRLNGYVERISESPFECYCGHQEFRTGINRLRICTRCQVPETSIIRRRMKLARQQGSYESATGG